MNDKQEEWVIELFKMVKGDGSQELSCKAQDMLDFIRDLRSKDRDTLIERIDNELPYYLRSITTKDGTKDVKVFIKEDVKQIILETLN